MKKDARVVLGVSFVAILVVTLLPFLLIFLTGNNRKESELAHQTAVVTVSPLEQSSVSRIQEANDAKAKSDVRQAAAIVEACVTKELGLNNANVYSSTNGCASRSFLTTKQYARTIPVNVALTVSATKTAICVYSVGGAATTYWYSTSTGTVESTPPADCVEKTS